MLFWIERYRYVLGTLASTGLINYPPPPRGPTLYYPAQPGPNSLLLGQPEHIYI